MWALCSGLWGAQGLDKAVGLMLQEDCPEGGLEHGLGGSSEKYVERAVREMELRPH